MKGEETPSFFCYSPHLATASVLRGEGLRRHQSHAEARSPGSVTFKDMAKRTGGSSVSGQRSLLAFWGKKQAHEQPGPVAAQPATAAVSNTGCTKRAHEAIACCTDAIDETRQSERDMSNRNAFIASASDHDHASSKCAEQDDGRGFHGQVYAGNDGMQSMCDGRTDAHARPAKQQRSALLTTLENSECREEAKRKEVEQRFSWLEPGHVRDAHGRPESHPDHDKRTLRVPPHLKLSSSQQQYWDLKKRYRDVILFIRIGSFHELYGEDAEVGARELGWKMTFSGVGNCKQVGCPSSNVDAAVSALVAKGYKVAKIEQMETAQQAKQRAGQNNACIRRELVTAHSPETITEGCVDGAVLPATAVHVLALCESTNEIGFAFLEAAAGRAFVGAIPNESDKSSLVVLLAQVEPSEALFPKQTISQHAKQCIRMYTSTLTALEPTTESPYPPHDISAARDFASTTRFVHSADTTSWPEPLQTASASTLSSLCCLSSHLRRMISERELAGAAEVLPYAVHAGSLLLKGRTAHNLELAGCHGSVFSHIDRSCTSPGRRMLKRWLMRPFRRVEQISERQNAVLTLMQNEQLMQTVRSSLRKCPDVERAIGRLKSHREPPPEGLPDDLLSNRQKRRHGAITAAEHACAAAADVLENIANHLKEASAFSSNNYSSSIDGHEENAKLLSFAEAHNDATNAAQTAKAGRNLDVSDDENISKVIESLLDMQASIRRAADSVAELDALTSFALFGIDCGGGRGPTCIPHLQQRSESESPSICAKSLWNLCVQPEGQPVPNDIYIGTNNSPRTLLLSGANMCGKSTMMRAVCIAAVLAHCGAPVPAEYMELTSIDAIFTRVGARDDVLSGESTFLVECNEASTMLQEATEDSLLLVDELGRGTSTVDGYSIAYAALLRLSRSNGPRVLFSTHFHGLTQDFVNARNVRQTHMACGQGADGQLTFLYKLRNGPCPRSYGLQVAQMAGIPKHIIDRAMNAADAAAATNTEHTESALALEILHALECDSRDRQHAELLTAKLALDGYSS